MKTIKILALLSSFILMSSFVAYKSGIIEIFLNKENHSTKAHIHQKLTSTPLANVVDTPSKPKSERYMGGSKSDIIYRPIPKTDTIKKDTIQKKPEKKAMIGGSKSFIIYNPTPDTIKKTPQK